MDGARSTHGGHRGNRSASSYALARKPQTKKVVMYKKVLRELKHIGASVAAASIFVGVLFSPSVSQASDETASSALTSSAKTVAAVDYELDYAHSPMPDLKVTVSQTKDLTSQGIEVSWTGASPESTRPTGSGGTNYMQIFQCWGEDPNRPGHPDRTTCQYGAYLTPGSSRADATEPDKVASWSAVPLPVLEALLLLRSMPSNKGCTFPIVVLAPVGNVFLASRLTSVFCVRAACVFSSNKTVMMSPTW
jgi:hypothetical protein